MTLTDVPLTTLLNEAVVPYEHDEVTGIIDTHDAVAFGPVAHLTVGDFRNWLLSDAVDSAARSGSAWHHATKWRRRCPKSCATRPDPGDPKPGGLAFQKHHWLPGRLSTATTTHG
jgi:hypothetical protein